MEEQGGLLFVVCDHCKNPLIVPPDVEKHIVYSDVLVCPDCEGINFIDEELRDYILATSQKEI